VLPDEKEDRDGFRACLALNHGEEHRRLVARYGPFRELCLVAEDAGGATVGGANFLAAPVSGPDGAWRIAANLNYIYVAPAFQRRGLFRRLVEAVADTARSQFGEAASSPLLFLEQNDPFAMSEEAYDRDTRLTGLDQFARLGIWARLGARVVDFPYVQPALSADQAPDSTLVYSVIGAGEPVLPAWMLHSHLTRFFGISVLKGRPVEDDSCAAGQLAALAECAARGADIALRDPLPLLAAVGSRGAAADILGSKPASFREALALFRLGT
jgi:GNAT superfamily N-acetyltransferase